MPDLYDLADLILVTVGYWMLDRAARADGWARLVRRIGLRRQYWVAASWSLPWLALAPVWRWEHVSASADIAQPIRVLSCVLAVMLTWKAVTRDYDVGTGESDRALRVILLVSTCGVFVSPAFVLVVGFLLSNPFGIWEHHATLPMRVLQTLMVFVCLSSVLASTPLGGVTGVLFFLVTLLVSHYLITALAKILLGRKWYSWVSENHLHHLAASAYSWGWARFLSWPTWRKVVLATKRSEKLLQLSAFSIELLAPLALLNARLAVGFCLAWAGFHVGVFALSGLLFWDWIVTNLALAYVISALPLEVTNEVFGPGSVLVAIAFMVLFPLRHKLWKPMPLGWFDTPFTQRVVWVVRGESGRDYGLYNNFMCPHERLYGKVHGCFLVPVPVLTYHLGEVFKWELRDAIRSAGPDLTALQAVRERFGVLPRSDEMTNQHVAYLRRFLQQLNRGAKKHALPRAWRWLKAPGDQVFYWGELPAFRRQEKAVSVGIYYREEYFDGHELVRLRDELVVEVPVETGDVLGPVREFTPKEVDDFLMTFAVGRLIDLPGFRQTYVHGDDGKRV